MSSDVVAAAVAATVLWVVSVGAFLMETPKRPSRRGVGCHGFRKDCQSARVGES